MASLYDVVVWGLTPRSTARYVAAQAQKARVEFTKQENCFTSVSNATGLAKIADTLSEKETAGRLRQLCARWIYSTCLCFALDLAEQEKSRFQYQNISTRCFRWSTAGICGSVPAGRWMRSSRR